MPASQLDVDYLFSVKLDVAVSDGAFMKNGPSGTRYVASVPGGTFDGPKLRGTVLPPGGDWVTMRPNRTMGIDVRLLLATDDGAGILMQYKGIGTPAENGLSLRTAPLFETGDERYAWLNDVQAVGIGSSDGTNVTYEIYALK